MKLAVPCYRTTYISPCLQKTDYATETIIIVVVVVVVVVIIIIIIIIITM
jgi:hypothetical protein